MTHNNARVFDRRKVIGKMEVFCRLVKLRNPWGRFTWKGEFGNESCLWTRELRARLMPEGMQEGAFWIPFEQFSKLEYAGLCSIGWVALGKRTLPPQLDGFGVEGAAAVYTAGFFFDLTAHKIYETSNTRVV